MNENLNNPSDLGPNLIHNIEIERLFREFYDNVAGIREEFMKHPQRDKYEKPLYSGFELPDETVMLANGDLISRTYSKTQELTEGSGGKLVSQFAANTIELSVVGKLDLEKGFYDGFGLDLAVGDIVVMLWSETDESETYQRTIVKYSETDFAIIYKS